MHPGTSNDSRNAMFVAPSRLFPLGAGIGLLVAATCGAAAVAAPAPGSATELKKLSLEDLMNVQVTTVSRGESTIGRSPPAVFVITQEMIRRSGRSDLRAMPVAPFVFRNLEDEDSVGHHMVARWPHQMDNVICRVPVESVPVELERPLGILGDLNQRHGWPPPSSNSGEAYTTW